jgi:putative tricarboxylic transport membrane protein
MKRATITAAAISVSALVISACGSDTAESGSDFPENDVTVIAASAPGGSLDSLARVVNESSNEHDLLDVGMSIENLGAGGGNVARTEILNRPNDGHTVVMETNRIFLNPLSGTTELNVEDFTPIANMVTDYMVWAVQGDSEWQSVEEILDAVSEDPTSVNFGVGTVPSDDQFNILAPVNESGVTDPSSLNITTFDGGADLKASLLGGDVDVASTSFSELTAESESGDVRFLVTSAPEPQDGVLEGVPTWEDEGIDYSLEKWLGVFGPADMPEESLTWWQDYLEEVTTTDSWAEQMEARQLNSDFMGSEEFEELVYSQRDDAEELINLLNNGE